jgi:branched-chain amino acid transport system ATP-binding protein
MDSLLEVRDLVVSYGAIEALRGVSFDVREGEVVTIIGANGAGKSSLMKAVAGLLRPRSGSITLRGQELAGLSAHRVATHGIVMVPEGRHLFADQTVTDNLLLGTRCRRPLATREVIAGDLQKEFDRFPRMRERASQLAGTLSGGEQQMVAISRALMGRPRILLMDEPSLGLAPLLVREVFASIQRLRDEGVTILLVEQMAYMALEVAVRGYVLEQGRITHAGPAKELTANPEIARAYLGRT